MNIAAPAAMTAVMAETVLAEMSKPNATATAASPWSRPINAGTAFSSDTCAATTRPSTSATAPLRTPCCSVVRGSTSALTTWMTVAMNAAISAGSRPKTLPCMTDLLRLPRPTRGTLDSRAQLDDLCVLHTNVPLPLSDVVLELANADVRSVALLLQLGLQRLHLLGQPGDFFLERDDQLQRRTGQHIDGIDLHLVGARRHVPLRRTDGEDLIHTPTAAESDDQGDEQSDPVR